MIIFILLKETMWSWYCSHWLDLCINSIERFLRGRLIYLSELEQLGYTSEMVVW